MFKTFKLLRFLPAIMISSKCTTFGKLFLRKVTKSSVINAFISAQNVPKCVWLPSFTRTCCGTSQCSLRPRSWIQGILLLRGREGECAQFCIQIWGIEAPGSIDHSRSVEYVIYTWFTYWVKWWHMYDVNLIACVAATDVCSWQQTPLYCRCVYTVNMELGTTKKKQNSHHMIEWWPQTCV